MSTVLTPAPAAPEAPAALGPSDERLERMARAFATLFLEVEAGLRPRRQLQPLLCPVLFARLEEAWLREGQRRGQLVALRGDRAAPGRYEAVCLVRTGSRIRALAFRLRRGAGGWRVDDLARPEDGPLPPPAYPVPQDEPDVFELVMA